MSYSQKNSAAHLYALCVFCIIYFHDQEVLAISSQISPFPSSCLTAITHIDLFQFDKIAMTGLNALILVLMQNSDKENVLLAHRMKL